MKELRQSSQNWRPCHVVQSTILVVVLSAFAAGCSICQPRTVGGMNVNDLRRGIENGKTLWQYFMAQNSVDELAERSPSQYIIESQDVGPVSVVAYMSWLNSPDIGWRVEPFLTGLALPGVRAAKNIADILPDNVAWCVLSGPDPIWRWPSSYPLFISKNLTITTEELRTKSADDYLYCTTNAPFGKSFSMCVRHSGEVSIFAGSRVRLGELFPEYVLTNRVNYSIWRPDLVRYEVERRHP